MKNTMPKPKLAFDFERQYTLREAAELRAFVEAHAFLAPLLVEAHGHIQKHFPGSQVFLEQVVDPETEGYEHLVVSIGTNLTSDDAVRRLQRFDHTWWLDSLQQAEGKLCITLGFR